MGFLPLKELMKNWKDRKMNGYDHFLFNVHSKKNTMKKKNNHSATLGVFVFLGVLFFTVGIYFIGKKQQLFNTTFRISGIFKDINGLQVGNNVRFSGINVGVVENIAIVTDTTVKVEMNIDENARKFIKSDARAIVGSDGLMGNKIVSIIPGSPDQKEIADNATIGTSTPVSFDEILERLKAAGTNAANITEDLAVITDNIRSGNGTIGKLFMDTLFAKNIDQTIVNIKQGAGGFKQNMTAASHNFLLRGFFKKKKDKNEKNDKKQEDKTDKDVKHKDGKSEKKRRRWFR
jgi:phospholipid/cholesterol/gamma-HCH transport system substrate-binding protein